MVLGDKITELGAAVQPIGALDVPVVQGGVTVRAPADTFGAKQHINEYFVAKDGHDTNGNGSQVAPFLTVAKANAVIGNAADDSEWNDITKRFYVIHVGPGDYAEVVTNVPARPFVVYDAPYASFTGAWTRTFPQDLIETGLGSPQLIFKGVSRRASWDGTAQHIHNGIIGNLNIANNGQVHGSFFPQVHLLNFGVDGDVLFTTPLGTGPNNQLFLEHAFITGKTDFPAAASGSCNVFAEGGIGNEDTGDVLGIGGFTGKAQLFHLENVLISGDCSPTGGQSGCRWYNVRLLDSKTLDFSGNSSSIGMDDASLKDYLAAVAKADRHTGTLSRLDDATLIGSLYNDTLGGTQVVATATTDVCEAFDTENIGDENVTVTAASYKMEVDLPGKYNAEFSLNFSANANNLEAVVGVYKNGSLILPSVLPAFFKTSGDRENLAFSVPVKGLVAGDELDIRIAHDDGGNITFTYYGAVFSLYSI